MNLFGRTLALPNFRLQKVVNVLMDDARSAQMERRIHGRLPFFQSAVIETTNPQGSFSVFARDVSRDGMGLLHNMPIEPQIVTVAIRSADEEVRKFQLEVCWCLACGEGWYISGGGFVGRSARPHGSR